MYEDIADISRKTGHVSYHFKVELHKTVRLHRQPTETAWAN